MIDDLVPVYVPRARLPEVYALLASEISSPAAPTSSEPADWPPELLHRLVRESPPGMRVILEALALAPDTWLTADDLADALRERLPAHGGPKKPKADWNTVAGTLGAFGRRFKNRYAAEHASWPFKLQNNYELDRWTYSMSPDIAQSILVYLRKGA